MFDLMRSELLGFACDVATADAARRFIAEDADAAPDGGALPERLDRLAALTGQSSSELRFAFGRRVFERFASSYPDFIPEGVGALDFLMKIESHVHGEMTSLYPSAAPPRLCCERLSETRAILRYASDQPVAEMCAGMLEAALSHFETRAVITRRADADRGADAVFEIESAPAA